MLLSIIVAVYGAENYLKSCIESILDQDFKDYELILVDDGSKDNSGEICDFYAGKDDRIKVIHKKNGGVSSARNAGLRIARGKYVQFLDSDDTLVKHSLFNFYQQTQKLSADLYIGSSYVRDRNDKVIDNISYNNDRVVNKLDILNNISHNYKAITFHYVWNRWYLKEVIDTNNIVFDESIALGEDFVFNCEYIRYIERIAELTAYICNYYKRGNESLTGRFDRRELERRRKMERVFIKLYEENGILEKNIQKLKCIFGEMAVVSISAVVKRSAVIGFDEKVKYIREFLDSEYYGYICTLKSSNRFGLNKTVMLELLTRKAVRMFIAYISVAENLKRR